MLVAMNSKTPPMIHQFSTESWAQEFARMLSVQISECITTKGVCNVMLTGGRSAAQLYGAWALAPEFQRLTGVRFYFGDERCVPCDNPESNFGMVMRTLFSAGVPHGCTVHRMEADSDDLEAAAGRYDAGLPECVDFLLLSIGDDGHIASLFPHNIALQETRRRVVPVVGPKPPKVRLTITRPVIETANQLFVIACGDKKREILNILSDEPSDFYSIPARLALRAAWIQA